MAATINADNGVSSGSAGLKSSADSSGVLQLQTNGTVAVTVDTSQNVGIGTSSPTAKLDVVSASGANYIYSRNTGTTSADSAQMLCVSGSVTLQSYAYNFAGEAVTGTSSNHPLVFRTNNTERMRIDSSGNLLVGTTTAQGKLTVNGVIAPSGTAGTYSIDTTSNAATYANGATVGFANMSGVIIANSSTTGRCTIYAMGAGQVTVIGSAAGQCGTLAYSAGNNGYTWTNNYGSADTVAFMVFRTRAGA
jgi:hypothetical protein